MQNARVIATGYAARCVLEFLLYRPVGDVDLHAALRVAAGAVPKASTMALRTEVELLLAIPAGQWMAAGGEVHDHIRPDDPTVRRALELSAHIAAGDTIDSLEEILRGIISTISTPAIRNAVMECASALLRAPRNRLAGRQLAKVIGATLGSLQPGRFAPPAPMRKGLRRRDVPVIDRRNPTDG
jgi:hypothetical protein